MSIPEAGGVLIVNKPAGVTSHDVVNTVRRLYGTRQVGHTGTLDPMAEGVLPVLVGRAVKASDLLVSERKAYRADLQLGFTTDTEDVTGRVLTKSASLPSKEEVLAVCSSFTGRQAQTPPMYSALKKDGKKLVDLARAGVTVERAPREIEIYFLEVLTLDEENGRYRLNVECSKGTYIRTLCADIGKKLSCGGVMSALLRTASGRFSLKDAHTPAELEALSPENRAALLIRTEELFADLPALFFPPFFRRLAASGCEIALPKLGADYPVGQHVRMCGEDGFFALGEVRAYESGNAVKAVKLFVTGLPDGAGNDPAKARENPRENRAEDRAKVSAEDRTEVSAEDRTEVSAEDRTEDFAEDRTEDFAKQDPKGADIC